MKRFLMPAILLLCLAPPLAAATPDDALKAGTFVCPVGGEKFYQATGFYHWPLPGTYFPDGSHPGDELINVELPECPGNGLVMLPDIAAEETGRQSPYSAAELAVLPGLIASPEYRALRAESRHIRAFWLAQQLKRPAALQAELLIRATWGARNDAERKRYLEKLVNERDALIDASDFDLGQKLWRKFYVVNALRELGRFDAATTRYAALRLDDPAANRTDNRAVANEIGYLKDYAPQILPVIAAGNVDRHPVSMMQSRWVGAVCGDLDRAGVTQQTRSDCADRSRRLADEERADKIKWDEFAKFDQNPAARDAACATTPKAKRSTGLQQACEIAEGRRSEDGAKLLMKNPEKLAHDCAASPWKANQDALFYACIRFETVKQMELTDLLARDDAGYRVMCGARPEDAPEDLDDLVGSACYAVPDRRQEVAVEQLKLDPVKLDRACAAPESEQLKLGVSLIVACAARETDRKGKRPGLNPAPVAPANTEDDKDEAHLRSVARAAAADMLAAAKAAGTSPKAK